MTNSAVWALLKQNGGPATRQEKARDTEQNPPVASVNLS